MALTDDAPAACGGGVDELERLPTAALGRDDAERQRDAAVDGEVTHAVERTLAYRGIRVVRTFRPAFENADAEIAHHPDEAYHFVPGCETRGHGTVVGCLVVLAARCGQPECTGAQ